MTTEKITFRELSDALLHLGFQKKTTAQFTVFRKEDQGAMIVLPPESSIVNVLPRHITAARETVVGRGVANSQEFDHLLSSGTTRKNGVLKKNTASLKSVAEGKNRRVARIKQPVKGRTPILVAKRVGKTSHQDDKITTGD